MLNGTKKLFPNDYKKFTEAMIQAAEDDELPVMLQLENLKDYTLNDFQDMFYEFEKDTGLFISGEVFLCDDCGRLHLTIVVDYPKEDNNKLIQ